MVPMAPWGWTCPIPNPRQLSHGTLSLLSSRGGLPEKGRSDYHLKTLKVKATLLDGKASDVENEPMGLNKAQVLSPRLMTQPARVRTETKWVGNRYENAEHGNGTGSRLYVRCSTPLHHKDNSWKSTFLPPASVWNQTLTDSSQNLIQRRQTSASQRLPTARSKPDQSSHETHDLKWTNDSSNLQTLQFKVTLTILIVSTLVFLQS